MVANGSGAGTTCYSMNEFKTRWEEGKMAGNGRFFPNPCDYSYVTLFLKIPTNIIPRNRD